MTALYGVFTRIDGFQLIPLLGFPLIDSNVPPS